jgi:hypothetical protein
LCISLLASLLLVPASAEAALLPGSASQRVRTYDTGAPGLGETLACGSRTNVTNVYVDVTPSGFGNLHYGVALNGTVLWKADHGRLPLGGGVTYYQRLTASGDWLFFASVGSNPQTNCHITKS